MKYSVVVAGEEFAVEFQGNDVLVDGNPVEVRLESSSAPDQHRFHRDGRCDAVALWRTDGLWHVQFGGEHHDVSVVDDRIRRLQELTGTGAAGGGETLKAPMPGMVLRIEVAEGDRVEPGQGVLVLEAMKMENEIRASTAGVVSAVRVAPGTAVEKGVVLVEIGADDDEGS